MKSLMNSYIGLVKKASDEDNDQSESDNVCKSAEDTNLELRLLGDADQHDF